MPKCEHNIKAKLIEIPGKDGQMFGSPEYEMDYAKLEEIARKQATGEGESVCYLEFLYCCKCEKILETHHVFTE